MADAVCYHPFDLPWSVILFFLRLKPQKYIITRHDIWPFHLYFARLLGIQTVFINANLYSNSTRFSFGLKTFNRWLFHQFDLILTGSENLKNTIMNLAPRSNIKITGDSRFDQIIDRKNNNTQIPYLNNILDQSFNIIFGSYDMNDENIIIQSLLN